MAGWHAGNPFSRPVSALIGWCRERVANPVVDSAQARGIKISQPGRLYRRRLTCEHRKAMVHGMPREIHQNIQLIVQDHINNPLVWVTRYVSPVISVLSE